jgi:hypothetical protein
VDIFLTGYGLAGFDCPVCAVPNRIRSSPKPAAATAAGSEEQACDCRVQPQPVSQGHVCVCAHITCTAGNERHPERGAAISQQQLSAYLHRGAAVSQYKSRAIRSLPFSFLIACYLERSTAFYLSTGANGHTPSVHIYPKSGQKPRMCRAAPGAFRCLCPGADPMTPRFFVFAGSRARALSLSLSLLARSLSTALPYIDTRAGAPTPDVFLGCQAPRSFIVPVRTSTLLLLHTVLEAPSPLNFWRALSSISCPALSKSPSLLAIQLM